MLSFEIPSYSTKYEQIYCIPPFPPKKHKFPSSSLVCMNVIYIYIESDYGTLQSTEALCVLRSIFNFKSEIIDPEATLCYNVFVRAPMIIPQLIT
jgi:hypothetical protein